MRRSCGAAACLAKSAQPGAFRQRSVTQDHSMILATTPAPTVRPPSRIAKRRPSSIAIGVISLTVMLTLSPRHHHLLVLGQLHRPRHVGRAEVELRPVVVEERRVAAAFFLAQHVDLGREVGVRLDAAGLAQHLAALHVFALGAAQQDAHVVARLALVEQLAEHLDAGAGGLLRRGDADDLDFLADLDDAALDAARHDGAATGDARTRLPPASGRRRRPPARAWGCRCPALRRASGSSLRRVRPCRLPWRAWRCRG